VQKVDTRVIAASNKDLEELVRDGLFRRDLYFRLKVVELFLPPLRERPEDIPLLVNHYLQRQARLNNKPVKDVEEEAMALLQTYPWPGNVRELVNAVERAVILSTRPQLGCSDLPPHIASFKSNPDGEEPLLSLAEVEKRHIQQVLLRTSSLEEAARVLGINATTLWRKRKQSLLD
jgi:DNA-binding NtrC family response regulator